MQSQTLRLTRLFTILGIELVSLRPPIIPHDIKLEATCPSCQFNTDDIRRVNSSRLGRVEECP